MGASASLQERAQMEEDAGALYAQLLNGAEALTAAALLPCAADYDKALDGAPRPFAAYFDKGEDGALKAKAPEETLPKEAFITVFLEQVNSVARENSKPLEEVFRDAVLVCAGGFYTRNAEAAPRPKDGALALEKEATPEQRAAAWAAWKELKPAAAAAPAAAFDGAAACATVNALLKEWQSVAKTEPKPFELYSKFWAEDSLRMNDTVTGQFARQTEGRGYLTREDMTRVAGEMPFLNFCDAIGLVDDVPAAFDLPAFKVFVVNHATCVVERQLAVARTLEGTQPHQQQMMLLHVMASLISSDGRGRARAATVQNTANKGRVLFGKAAPETPRKEEAKAE